MSFSCIKEIWCLMYAVKHSCWMFRYIKIQPKTTTLSTKLWGINPTNSVDIAQSFVLRSFALGWILIYRNWSIDLFLERGIIYFECTFFWKRGPNLETWAAQISTQIPRYPHRTNTPPIHPPWGGGEISNTARPELYSTSERSSR